MDPSVFHKIYSQFNQCLDKVWNEITSPYPNFNDATVEDGIDK